jgi:hypothetical protein
VQVAPRRDLAAQGADALGERVDRRLLAVDLLDQAGGVEQALAQLPPITHHGDGHDGRGRHRQHEQRRQLAGDVHADDAGAVSAHEQQAELPPVIHPLGRPPRGMALRVLRGF